MTQMDAEITVLVENTASAPGLIAEHGLAVHVRAGEASVLFDTGQSPSALPANARALGVDLGAVSAAALSHGHYDHTGGLAAFLAANDRARLFMHPDAARPHFHCAQDGPATSIGLPEGLGEALDHAGDRITWTTSPTTVCEGVHLTGRIPRRTTFERVSGAFFKDAGGQTPDRFDDDQALWLTTDSGIVVVLGCAHAGVVNTLETICEVTGESEVFGVIGGMHLGAASESRLEATADGLRRRKVRLLAPCHCTGGRATAFLAEAFPDAYRPCSAGTVFSFP